MSGKESVKKPDFNKISENKARKKQKKRRKNIIIAIAAIIVCAAGTAAVLLVSFAANAGKAELTACTWVPQIAKDASGDEAELSDVYDVNYSSYQGSLTFGSDGTFSLWLSPGNPDDGTHSGTYELLSDNAVTLNFDDGSQTDIELERKNGEITCIVVAYGDYEVSFVKS